MSLPRISAAAKDFRDLKTAIRAEEKEGGREGGLSVLEVQERPPPLPPLTLPWPSSIAVCPARRGAYRERREAERQREREVERRGTECVSVWPA